MKERICTMMLLQVTYTMRPGKREDFLKDVRESGLLEDIRKEDGCQGYAYYLPEEEDGTLLLIERWATPQAQKVHMESENMARLRGLKDQYITDTKLLSWELEG